MTVVWNCSAQSRQTLIPAIGAKAQVMDRSGNVQPIDVAADGYIHVTLAPATANTIPGYPETYFIGGEPALVLESLPSDYAPYPPTYANLPDPGQP